MNKLIPIIFFLLPGIVNADELLKVKGERSPDIVVQTLFNDYAQNVVVEEVRKLLEVNLKIDPLKYTISESMETAGDLGSDMDQMLKDILDGLLEFDFSKGKVNVKMTNLRYDIKKSVIEIKNMRNSGSNSLDFDLFIKLSDTTVNADEVKISFNSLATQKVFLDEIAVDMKNPSVYSKDLNSLTMQMHFNVSLNSQNKIEINSSDSSFDTFKSIGLLDLEKDIELDPGTVDVSNIDLNIGAGVHPLQKEGIAKAIQIRKRNIAELMLNPLVTLIKTLPQKLSKTSLKQLLLDSQYPVKLPPVDAQLSFNSFGQVGENQLRLGADLDTKDHDHLPQDPEKFAQSMAHIQQLIAVDTASTVISIAEEAINSMIEPIIDEQIAKLLPKNVKLGPKMIKTHMDQGPNGIVAIDMEVDTGFFGGVVLGKRTLQVPVILLPKIEFAQKDGNPTLKVSFTGADLSEETLLNGAYDIDSNLSEVRLKKKVLKMLRTQVDKIVTDTKVELPLLALGKTPMTFATVESDGFGRLNILLKLDPERDADIQNFWNNLPYVFQGFLKKK